MCSALARRGEEVRLAFKHCPSRQEPGVEDPYRFYGVEPDFTLLPLPRPPWRGGGLLFAWRMRRLLARDRRNIDLAYCRDAAGAWLAHRAGVPLVFEAHQPPEGPVLRRLYRAVLSSPHCRLVVAISAALATRLCGELPLRSGLPVVVAPDAADPMPEVDPSVPGPALGGQRPRVGYVGQLYPGKGVDLVLELARRTPEMSFHVIGGEPAAIAGLRSGGLPANAFVHGFVPPGELASWYRGLDVLLLPYSSSVSGASGRTDLAPWMSPMKLFEGMAAGRPILASDLPVLREVIHAENALLLPPEDVAAWGAALRQLAERPERARALGARARADFLAHYTFDARAGKVLDALAC